MSGDAQPMYKVVFMLGRPGAGKGTQCQKIEEMFGYVHLSAGDLLRAEKGKADSMYRELIESHTRDGTLVPVEVTCSLLKQAMEDSGKDKFLIDGFPRNKDNLDGWNSVMNSVAVVGKVISLNCPLEVCVERCLHRGKTSGRDDDNIQSLKKRNKTHTDSTIPIIEHYRQQSLLAEINADQTVDEVFQDVKQVFNGLPF